MNKLKYVKLENEDGSYSSSIPLAVDSDYVDVNGETLTNKLNNKAEKSQINNLQSQINGLASGSPLVASSVSRMTDTTRVYVNTTDGNWYYYNGSAWTIGGVYQASQDSNSLILLINKFDPFYKGIIPIYNMMDNSSIDDDTYYQNAYGIPMKRTASGYITIEKIPVRANKKYVAYLNGKTTGNIAGNFSYLTDINGNIIEQLQRPDIHSFIPSQDGYAYITFMKNTSYDYENSMITLEGFQKDTFQPFGVPYNFLICNTNYIEMYDFYDSIKDIDFNTIHHQISVGPNKDFTTISSAVASITDSSANKIYDVLIDDGTYNEHSINLPNYVNLIGASGNKDDCIIRGYLNPSVSDSEHRGISTIDLSMNNELKNLTITAQNMRYPIHDESNGANTDWVQLVDNCHIEHLGNQEIIDYRSEHELDPGNPWTSCHAWGEGASSGAKLTIKDTTLKSVENAFYVHGASNMVKPYYHELINCKLITSNENKIAIYVDNNTPTIDDNTLIVKNCFIGGRYAIVANTHKYNAMFSGSGIKPVYQRPGQVCADWSFPLFTDYMDEYIAGETLTKGTFVYTTDGRTIYKANATTDKKLIVGYVIGNQSIGDLVKVMKGYLQPSTQTWPETPMTSNKYYIINNNGLLEETESIDNAIAISNDYAYKLFI